MSLILRGMGPTASLITAGLGPPADEEEEEVVVATTTKIPGDHDEGGGSRGYRRGSLYDHLAESLYVKRYRIGARLLSVNGKDFYQMNESMIEVKSDERDSFSVRLNENVEVKKTTPSSNIFISILDIFKR